MIEHAILHVKYSEKSNLFYNVTHFLNNFLYMYERQIILLKIDYMQSQ